MVRDPDLASLLCAIRDQPLEGGTTAEIAVTTGFSKEKTRDLLDRCIEWDWVETIKTSHPLTGKFVPIQFLTDEGYAETEPYYEKWSHVVDERREAKRIAEAIKDRRREQAQRAQRERKDQQLRVAERNRQLKINQKREALEKMKRAQERIDHFQAGFTKPYYSNPLSYPDDACPAYFVHRDDRRVWAGLIADQDRDQHHTLLAPEDRLDWELTEWEEEWAWLWSRSIRDKSLTTDTTVWVP